MEEAQRSTLLNVSAMLAAVGASVCCTLPIVVAVLGVGSAALGATIAPLTPWFTGLTVVLLGYAFYRAYRPVKCAPGQACAVPDSAERLREAPRSRVAAPRRAATRRRQRIALWIVAVVALLLVTFPYYAAWLL